jgi:hypothetical protein
MTLLVENDGRLAIISAEGGLFDIIAGRYSKGINVDVWLKGHSGDPLKVDRKGRAPEYVQKPAITMGLMVQPDVLDAIAANRQFRGRGLLARFLYCFPVSKVGRRLIAAKPVDEAANEDYNEKVKSLAAGMSGRAGDRAVLTLTPQAQEAIRKIEEAVEPALGGEGELATLADWGSKFVGAVVRIAGILHLATYGASTGPTTPIEAGTIVAAWRIGEYYRACAIRAFDAMGSDREIVNARYLLGRIVKATQQRGVDEISLREIHQSAQRRFPKVDHLAGPVDRLVAHGYLIPVPPPLTTSNGRPPSPRFTVHTKATEAAEGGT